MKSPVDGHPNLVKDTETGIVHNRGVSDRERYRNAKRMAHQQHDSRHEINNLKKEIGEIKDLLHQLLDKK